MATDKKKSIKIDDKVYTDYSNIKNGNGKDIFYGVSDTYTKEPIDTKVVVQPVITKKPATRTITPTKKVVKATPVKRIVPQQEIAAPVQETNSAVDWGNEFNKTFNNLAPTIGARPAYDARNLKEQPKTAPETNKATNFYDKAEQIRLDTEATLKQIYGPNVKVNITQKERTAQQQAGLVAKGASATNISNHMFGEAADYQITINGKKQIGNTAQSLEPYLYLGGVARNHGMFWGWSDDSGHVGSTEYAYQTIQNNPKLAERDDIKAFYEANNKSTTMRYKPLMETLDQIYGKTSNRTYTGKAVKSTVLFPKYIEKKK